VTDPSPTSATPPTSAAAVAEHMSWTDQTDEQLARLEGTVAAVNAFVRRVATTSAPEQAQGALLLAARLWRRRNSPEGVATFTSDGAVYVQRNDPDVAQYLGIGHYAPPVVG
jgi:hypothetical protein